jgi:cation diffusion facilitator CzcD-associated flavoprotein CzcO
MESTVDKFHLRSHFRFGFSCLGARWNSKVQKWEVSFENNATGERITKSATIFISAVGGISEPRDVKFPGMESFKGEIFHTARWNHGYDWRGKHMAVIGNGCSAAQVVPSVATGVKQVTQ